MPTRPLPASLPLATDETRRARAYDEQGVSAFEAGRYHEALSYFRAAFDHGGPPSELWNEAKCRLRLDEPDQAETALVAYLASPGVTTADKRDAESTLEALRRRVSTLTVTSYPLGLSVFVDGRKLGSTPLTTVVSAGEHKLVVERAPGSRDERVVVARLGHSIIEEVHP